MRDQGPKSRRPNRLKAASGMHAQGQRNSERRPGETDSPPPSPPRPAHETKHIRRLQYRLFPSREAVVLSQDDSLADSTGRTLWLSPQVLSCYLLRNVRRPTADRPFRAVELGAGTGLIALTLASMNFDVVATDVEAVVDSVTRPNLENNSRAGWGSLTVLPLDWNEALPGNTARCAYGTDALDAVRELGPFDLITTSDTVYEPTLTEPLLAALAALSAPGGSPAAPPAPIYLALERRDPQLVDGFLQRAGQMFSCSLVDDDAVKEAVAGLGWSYESWEGVEIWILVYMVDKDRA